MAQPHRRAPNVPLRVPAESRRHTIPYVNPWGAPIRLGGAHIHSPKAQTKRRVLFLTLHNTMVIVEHHTHGKPAQYRLRHIQPQPKLHARLGLLNMCARLP